MEVLTIEANVNNGQIKLPSDVNLPEHDRVYVVVPDMKTEPTAHLFSPRLKNPNQAAEFEVQVIEESSNVGFGEIR
ncbi:MAG: hypothetical protein M3458_18005 [Acidobacteriota bacterium]|nr:hypothetical protein [Acidobacteriota bacterium]